jgi:hypothetical protein
MRSSTDFLADRVSNIVLFSLSLLDSAYEGLGFNPRFGELLYLLSVCFIFCGSSRIMLINLLKQIMLDSHNILYIPPF